jgi:nucleotide sugar dehydrogenase
MKASSKKKHHARPIGFIGQGWIGKHLADNYEARGFPVVRYAKEPAYADNKDALALCDIVFIAVPTPTTPKGFDASILKKVMGLLTKGTIAVVKSTVIPGTTDALQKKHKDLIVLHAPEFLRETSVEYDIANPGRNIIGVPHVHFGEARFMKAAERVLSILPKAPYESICRATEAEITKYAGNNFLYAKVVLTNVFYDLAKAYGADWTEIAKNVTADPRIGTSHMEPIHQYTHMGKDVGRGAGGHCFIKDFAAFREVYQSTLKDDKEAIELLRAFEKVNNKLLRDSKKDLDLLGGVYGE